MSWLDRLLRKRFVAKAQETMIWRAERAIDREMQTFESAAIAARLRVAKYEAMGRLTHTQEILRAQAVAQAECYEKVTSLAFREGLAKKIVAELLA